MDRRMNRIQFQAMAPFHDASRPDPSPWHKKSRFVVVANRCRRVLLLMSLILFGFMIPATVAKKSPPTSTTRTSTTTRTLLAEEEESPNARDLNDWVQARCNNNNNNKDNVGVWVYQGALYDPLEGRKIAHVQGLELVRCVANCVGTNNNNQRRNPYQEMGGDLEVAALLSQNNATFDRAVTVLSRKLFCYCQQQPSPEDQQQPQQLLQQIKIRPNAPLRKIPTKQAVAVYDTAITMIARRGTTELLLHTEWPDKQTIWGKAIRNNNINNNNHRDAPIPTTTTPTTKSFDFTVYARTKSANKKSQELFDLTQPPPQEQNSSSSSLPPIKRAKLIEFGTGSSRGKDKFGARETYSYSMIPSSSSSTTTTRTRTWWGRRPTTTTTRVSLPPPQVRYSRYGEGPPFLGPGRICTLELQGQRVTSLDDLPPLLASLIQERMSPLFLTSVYTSNNNGSHDRNKKNNDLSPVDDHQQQQQQQQNAVQQWRRLGVETNVLQVRPADDEREEFWLPDYLRSKGRHLWETMRRGSSSSSS
jgi:hypothetical protein